MPTPERIRSLAIHEAGHAVVGLSLGHALEYAVIDPRDETGAVQFRWGPFAEQGIVAVASAVAEARWQAPRLGLISGALDLLYGGGYRLESDRLDAERAAGGDPARLREFLRRAAALLSDPPAWAAVEALAAALLDRHRLGSLEAGVIYRRAVDDAARRAAWQPPRDVAAGRSLISTYRVP